MTYSSKGTKKIKDSNNSNKKLDKFYTRSNAAETVLSFLKELFFKEKININGYTFLEPCAGSGSFLTALNKVIPNSKVEAFDIEPEGSNIKKANFLEIKPHHTSNTITIGNPPFGYKGKLAVSFINQCSEWGPIVVFILPIQFRRYNIQKHIYSNLKLIYSSDNFPKNSFTLENKPYNVNCLFQIWVDKFSGLFENYNDLRLLEPLPNKHPDFKLYIHNNTTETLKYFNKEHYQWDFAVPRQGFYDYTAKITNPKELKTHVQYLFVKFIDPISKVIFQKIDFDKLSHVNTSILGFSNTDLIAEYIKVKATVSNKN
jgi:predicted RNA methylase